jgi:DNA-binding FadR family transcriptional regulator
MVISQIEEMIERGELRPGDKFPAEKALLDQFGVSRSVLREAFRVLEFRGIVRTTPGGGRYLRHSVGRSERDTALRSLQRASLLDVWETREVLEVRAAHLAALRRTDEDIDNLKKYGINACTPQDNLAAYLECNRELHKAIARATQNFSLAELVAMQMSLTEELSQKDLLNEERRNRMNGEHELIVEAIIDGEPEKAAQCMEAHLQNVKQSLLEQSGDS